MLWKNFWIDHNDTNGFRDLITRYSSRILSGSAISAWMSHKYLQSFFFIISWTTSLIVWCRYQSVHLENVACLIFHLTSRSTGSTWRKKTHTPRMTFADSHADSNKLQIIIIINALKALSALEWWSDEIAISFKMFVECLVQLLYLW